LEDGVTHSFDTLKVFAQRIFELFHKQMLHIVFKCYVKNGLASAACPGFLWMSLIYAQHYLQSLNLWLPIDQGMGAFLPHPSKVLTPKQNNGNSH